MEIDNNNSKSGENDSAFLEIMVEQLRDMAEDKERCIISLKKELDDLKLKHADSADTSNDLEMLKAQLIEQKKAYDKLLLERENIITDFQQSRRDKERVAEERDRCAAECHRLKQETENMKQNYKREGDRDSSEIMILQTTCENLKKEANQLRESYGLAVQETAKAEGKITNQENEIKSLKLKIGEMSKSQNRDETKRPVSPFRARDVDRYGVANGHPEDNRDVYGLETVIEASTAPRMVVEEGRSIDRSPHRPKSPVTRPDFHTKSEMLSVKVASLPHLATLKQAQSHPSLAQTQIIEKNGSTDPVDITKRAQNTSVDELRERIKMYREQRMKALDEFQQLKQHLQQPPRPSSPGPGNGFNKSYDANPPKGDTSLPGVRIEPLMLDNDDSDYCSRFNKVPVSNGAHQQFGFEARELPLRKPYDYSAYRGDANVNIQLSLPEDPPITKPFYPTHYDTDTSAQGRGIGQPLAMTKIRGPNQDHDDKQSVASSGSTDILMSTSPWLEIDSDQEEARKPPKKSSTGKIPPKKSDNLPYRPPSLPDARALYPQYESDMDQPRSRQSSGGLHPAMVAESSGYHTYPMRKSQSLHLDTDAHMYPPHPAHGLPTKVNASSSSIEASRPFVPHAPGDVTKGDVVKCSRQSGKICRGTVRFIGPLPDRSGVYLGLELDTNDGRHDGTFEGQRYFRCKNNRGVFVNFNKVILAFR